LYGVALSIFEKGGGFVDDKLFDDYPDVLDVVNISAMLHISKAKVYELIHDKQIKGFLIGRKFRVLKKEVISFICSVPYI
jgi:excisionase family DNA binding protein